VPSLGGTIRGAARADDGVLTVEGDGRTLGYYRIVRDRGQDTLTAVRLYSPGDLLPHSLEAIECLTSVEGRVWALVVGAGGQRHVYRMDLWRLDDREAVGMPLPVRERPVSRVTACAADHDHLALAFEDGQLRSYGTYGDRLSRHKWNEQWERDVSKVLSESRLPCFTTLALDKGQEHFIAAAGTGDIYRFTQDGIPEQQVEFPELRRIR
jgi:hypothetical protein